MSHESSQLQWSGATPRAWQAAALPVVLNAIRQGVPGVVSAIMGAGKSVLIAEVCASGAGRVVVTVPTVALVDQLYTTISRRCPGEVGRYYTHAKEAHKRITICCLPSLPALVADTAWPGPPSLWIADECHKTEAATVLETFEALAARKQLGFTATPFRSLKTEELSLWKTLVYEYSATDAMRDGVVVPYRVRCWTGAPVEIDDACTAMIRDVLPEGPGLVNAISIDDANLYADKLTAAGIPARAVHSQQPRATTVQTLDDLREGRLSAVVHVALLTEGVDLPWLRWLCMRRKVASTVRFCQEVGRVLRASPGKTHATLLDPHDLLDSLGLTYEAVLAGQAKEPDASPLHAALREAEAATADDDEKEAVWARRVAAWRAYLRQLYHAAIATGLVESRISATAWRRLEPTEKQLASAMWSVAGLSRETTIPPAHRRMLATVAAHRSRLRRGDVSDLMSVGFALRDARRDGVDAWSKIAALVDLTEGGEA